MTIAACYLSSEGVVLGADSTTTMYVTCPGPNPLQTEHHYNYAQKVFQIGKESTLGITMWGLGNLGETSYRTLIAEFADTLLSQGAQTVAEVAQGWNLFSWARYSQCFAQILRRVQQLLGQSSRTPDEEDELERYRLGLFGGFCIGGNLMHDRTPFAYEILYDPTLTAPGPITPLQAGSTRFWGCPNLIERLIFGLDTGIFQAIMQSGKWTGTQDELIVLMEPHFLGQPHHLPIREAIDWVHASIYTTIKTMKFSHMAPVCGGPVELAVITTDRPFRWVKHKRFDAAIAEGGLSDV